MKVARVIGNVVATRKNGKLEGAKLMLVQTLNPFNDSVSWGNVMLAVDTVQAGTGDTVLVVIEGRAAAAALGRRAAPVDAAIVGVVDQIEPVVRQSFRRRAEGIR